MQEVAKESTLSSKQSQIKDSLMLIHIVWLKPHPDADPMLIDDVVARILALENQIDEIDKIQIGWTVTDRANGFSLGVIVNLENQSALERYIDHPFHKAVVKDIARTFDTMAMDINV